MNNGFLYLGVNIGVPLLVREATIWATQATWEPSASLASSGGLRGANFQL